MVTFNQQTGADNPFNGINVGSRSAPTLADIDGDGDLNAVVGERDGTLNYFENNQPPAAVRDNVRTNEDTAFSGNVLVNNGRGADSDVDGDPLTVVAVNGVAANVGTEISLASGSLLTLNADGTFDFDPNGQFDALQNSNGVFTAAIEIVEYTISDGNGGTDTANVFFSINGVNDAAVVTGDIGGTVTEDAAINTTSGQLSATDIDSPNDFIPQTNTGGTYGTFAIDASGNWTYSLDNSDADTDALAAGEVANDVFNVATADGTLQAVTITVNGVTDNTAPNAVRDDVRTNEDTAFSGNVLVNNGRGADSDVDGDPLTVVAVNGVAANVGTEISLASGSLLTLNADGTFDYDPNGQFDALQNSNGVFTAGIEIVEYTISDGNGGTDTANVFFSINGVNDAAVVTGDIGGTVTEDAAINTTSGQLSATDVDSPNDFIPQTNTDGTYGTFAIDASGNWTYSLDNSDADTDALATGEVANDVFNVATADGTLQAVTITVNGVTDNTAPNAVRDAVTTDEDTVLNGSVFADNGSGADSDPEGDTLTITEVNGVAADVGTAVTLGSGAQLTLNVDGSFDYDPNGQFEALNDGETGSDSFTYNISDGNGGTDTATVTITITGVDDASAIAPPPTSNYRIFSNSGFTVDLVDGALVFSTGDTSVDAFLDTAIQSLGGEVWKNGNVSDNTLEHFGNGSNPSIRLNSSGDRLIFGGSGVGGSQQYNFADTHDASVALAFAQDLLGADPNLTKIFSYSGGTNGGTNTIHIKANDEVLGLNPGVNTVDSYSYEWQGSNTAGTQKRNGQDAFFDEMGVLFGGTQTQNAHLHALGTLDIAVIGADSNQVQMSGAAIAGEEIWTFGSDTDANNFANFAKDVNNVFV